MNAPSENSLNSVSGWIVSLKAGELEAASWLWKRYKDRLIELARNKFENVDIRFADEDDVAQSVFVTLCRGAAIGRFDDVRNRDDLWWLLLAITKRKAIDLIRRETAQKRGAGRVRSEMTGESGRGLGLHLDQMISDQPTPELLVMMEEEQRRLLGLLRDDRLRSIAVARIEGYTVAEIAANLAVSTRSIERKLQLIRNAWTKEFVSVEREPNSE
jgi:RNA polymerase sigma factor (sigma-70 family)